MSVTVRDMMLLSPLWRRASRKTSPRVVLRRKPAAPVTRHWEGVTAGLRGALIMASGLVLAGILGWLWATLTDPQLLPIKRVEVQGSFTYVDAQLVRDAVAPYMNGNFLTVDVHRVQKAVEGLPWVRWAEVRRSWPDAVHVSVTEQVAVAKWDEDSLVNDAGEVFRPPRASYPTGLPSLHGPEGSEKAVVMAFADMSAMVAPLSLHITRINLDERRAWSLYLDNGMQLVLGRGDGYGRLLKFVRFYRRALRDQAEQVERVDLRYSNGFAVRWQHTEKHN
jgi:cell division protein FtsQ